MALWEKGAQRRGDDLSLQGGRRAAAGARHLGAVGPVRRGGQCGRLPHLSLPRCSGDARAHPDGGGAHQAPGRRTGRVRAPMSWLAGIADGIAQHGAVVRVTVVRADGSTPREVGAAMLVGPDAVRDTIGGGALELAAISHARGLLAVPQSGARFPPLGGGVRGGGNPCASMIVEIPPLSLPTRGRDLGACVSHSFRGGSSRNGGATCAISLSVRRSASAAADMCGCCSRCSRRASATDLLALPTAAMGRAPCCCARSTAALRPMPPLTARSTVAGGRWR